MSRDGGPPAVSDKPTWKEIDELHSDHATVVLCECEYNALRARVAELEKALRLLNDASMAFWQAHGESCDGGDICDNLCVALMKAGAALAKEES